MSKVTIAGDVNGSGVFTISAPNGNTNRTLVLPDEAGTVLTSAGVPSSAMPAGSVLQVVQGVWSGQTSTTGTVYIATGLNAIITPSSASSKILVFGQVPAIASGSTTQPQIILYRGTTNIIGQPYGFGNIYSANAGYQEGMLPFSFLDSPSTTAATTYTIYMRGGGSGTASVGNGGRLAAITLMEIAA
jgi:hypothetical protein